MTALTTSKDIFDAIARVRRAMPRNADIMAICDALETATVKQVMHIPEKAKPVAKVTPIAKPTSKGRAKRAEG